MEELTLGGNAREASRTFIGYKGEVPRYFQLTKDNSKAIQKNE